MLEQLAQLYSGLSCTCFKCVVVLPADDFFDQEYVYVYVCDGIGWEEAP